MTRNGTYATTVLVALAGLAGCISATPNFGDATGDTVTIDMKDVRYQPIEVTVAVGTTVIWKNLDAVAHTVTPADKQAWGSEGSGDDSSDWLDEGDTYQYTFTEPGVYKYYCIPHAFQGPGGEWQGMVGTVVVTETGAQEDYAPPDVTVIPDPAAPARKAADPDGVVRFELTTHEVVAQLDDKAAFTFWTFDATVPGPMLRVQEGGRVEITVTNPAGSSHTHSIDLHAVVGPGGGAHGTQVAPGESKSFQFTALHPGLYVYHCATPPVPDHIANGMYGMILVEPEGGLAPVDREFYVVQGEVYTNEPAGSTGHLTFSPDKVRNEEPDYVLFNGRANALTGAGALTAAVGDEVRIFFGVGGAVPSSFHVIGEVFDRVYYDGDPVPSTHRQTVLVPAAGSIIVEFDVEYPATYVLVDHTLARTFDRGALGTLVVTGEADPAIYDESG